MEPYNNNRVRGKIVEMFGTIAEFCKATGISPDVVSLKLANKTRMSREDVETWATALQIEPADWYYYFFAHDAVKSRQTA